MSSEKPHPLDKLFHPKSIAVVGASSSEQAAGWVARLLEFRYPGHLYPVNPRADEINGLKAYPTVRDIPGPVDYAIFNVPARFAPQIMEDCVAKGVKAAHIYAAGFSETGKEEAKKLEARVASSAHENKVRVIGPNCMGVYYPAGGLTFNATFSKEPGNVAFVSQTGAGASRFVFLANDRHIHFSKVISYGNAVDLDSPDFLDYLADDIETGIIACYIEGAKDGRKFLNAIKKCLITKPVIVLKAGLTESGAGAAASHTASIAGSKSVWEAFFTQSGAIPVNTLEEITDVILALLRMPCPKGRRVGIVGRGGGLGVIATDTCERAGLKVPPFLPETRRQLEEIIPEAGAGVRNPVESDRGMSGTADFYDKGLKIVDADPQIDFILIHNAVDVYGGRQADLPEQVVKTAEVLANTAHTLTKPMAVILSAGEHLGTVTAVFEARETLMKAGIAVYPTIEAAANAIGKVIKYHEITEKR
ncbi:acetate--CoA ligase family protein [Chloroflexota bacterium]